MFYVILKMTFALSDKMQLRSNRAKKNNKKKFVLGKFCHKD